RRPRASNFCECPKRLQHHDSSRQESQQRCWAAPCSPPGSTSSFGHRTTRLLATLPVLNLSRLSRIENTTTATRACPEVGRRAIKTATPSAIATLHGRSLRCSCAFDFLGPFTP